MEAEVTVIIKKSDTEIYKQSVQLTMVSPGHFWVAAYNGLPIVEISRRKSRNFVTERDVKINLLPLKNNGLTVVEDKTDIVLKMNKILLKHLNHQSPLAGLN
jgi:hypothetical protein